MGALHTRAVHRRISLQDNLVLSGMLVLFLDPPLCLHVELLSWLPLQALSRHPRNCQAPLEHYSLLELHCTVLIINLKSPLAAIYSKHFLFVESVHLLQKDEGEDGVGAEAEVVGSESLPQREETFSFYHLEQFNWFNG